MGGYGSGMRFGQVTKTVVEHCLVLSANKLQHGRQWGGGCFGGGMAAWVRAWSGEDAGAVRYVVNTLAGEVPTIELTYTMPPDGEDGERLKYSISLTKTPLPWGGVRWWFTCPLTLNGRVCGRRVGKLYLPPGGRYFGCRHCYGLTYTSCQESHKCAGLWALLARNMGVSARAVEWATSARGRRFLSRRR